TSGPSRARLACTSPSSPRVRVLRPPTTSRSPAGRACRPPGSGFSGPGGPAPIRGARCAALPSLVRSTFPFSDREGSHATSIHRGKVDPSMGTKLYVGNLNFSTTEDALRAAFAANGRVVKDVAIPSDRETGRPRGFAFVEMGSDSDAKAAIAALD